MRLRLSVIRRSPALWQGFRSHARRAATQFFFRPRPWVRQLSACLERRDGLRTERYVSIFVRQGGEKAAELHSKLPPTSVYEHIAQRLTRALDLRHVHLQSSSGEAVAHFAAFASRVGLVLSYTDNHRSEHDSHGGREASLAMTHGTVGHTVPAQP